MQRNRLTTTAVALAAALGLAACGAGNDASTATAGAASTPAATAAASSGSTPAAAASSTSNASGASTSSALLADNAKAHAEEGDPAYDAEDVVKVTLQDGASSASTQTGVQIDGDTVTISAPGTYVLSGTLTDGTIVVNSADEGRVRLVLDNAAVTNSQGAALNIVAADEAVVVLEEGTTNSLADGTGYDTSAEDAPNAALFSMADLTIGGSGTLTVTGNTNDGIASKDGLVILGGTVDVTAADDGIRGKDYLVVQGGTVTVTAGDDGLKSDNEDDDTVGYILLAGGTTTVDAGDDGAHAEGDLAVTGGSVTITKSNEGLEGANVVIAGGTSSVTASDDGLNATQGSSSGGGGMGGGGMANDGSQLVISGGTLVVDSGGDGLDSNGQTTISGGTTVVYGPTMNGNGSLDSNGGIDVTGGTVLAAGSGGMAEAPDTSSTQGWVQLGFSSNVTAGQTVQIVSGDTVIASFTAKKDYSNLVFVGDDITSGQSYDVYVGSGSLGSDQLATFSLGGSTDGATKVGSVTAGQATGGMGGPR